MDTSGKAFVEHWDWAADKGIIKVNTSRALSAASRQVLKTVYPENWQELDVLELDVNEVVQRFRNLGAKNYKPSTLAQYERRFERAIEYFTEFIENPSEWQPIAAPRKGKSARGSSSDSTALGQPFGETALQWGEAGNGDAHLITYPFPLREDCVVTMRLPVDLSHKEVDRLESFMRTLTRESEGGGDT